MTNKLKDAKNQNLDFNILSGEEKFILSKILKKKSKNFSDKYGKYLIEDKNGKMILNNKRNFLNELLADEDNFDYIIDNIPGFIMSSGGCPSNVSSILLGRPSKFLNLEDYKGKEKELEKIIEKMFDKNLNELNSLTISTKKSCICSKRSY